MSNDKTETGRNTDVAATTGEQRVERNAKGELAPAIAPRVRPWTDDFLLPSISFREPKRS